MSQRVVKCEKRFQPNVLSPLSPLERAG